MPSRDVPSNITMTSEKNPPDDSKRCLGLVRRRQCLVPTRRGWLVLGLMVVVGFLVCWRGSYPFLALNAPVKADVLVVEGWSADYGLEAAMTEFKRGGYQKLFVTGVPLERGAPLSEYKTYAELGAASVAHMGMLTNLVQAVPAPKVQRDRTYASAIALRSWFEAHDGVPARINVVTIGAHSRRSRLLYAKAFGNSCEIGMIAVPDEGFPANRWWAYSQGVRTVVDEGVAYLYVRLFFDWAADR